MSVGFNGSLFDNFNVQPGNSNASVQRTEQMPKPKEIESDTCAFKQTKNGKTKVNVLRIWFNRLTKEQIAQINETGKLPDNMKIRPKTNGTGYNAIHNIFGLKNGTKTVPEGYEFRQNILGFTRIVPKDTEGFWLRKKQV